MRQILRQLALLREAVRSQPASVARDIQLSQITTARLQVQLETIDACHAALEALLRDV